MLLPALGLQGRTGRFSSVFAPTPALPPVEIVGARPGILEVASTLTSERNKLPHPGLLDFLTMRTERRTVIEHLRKRAVPSLLRNTLGVQKYRDLDTKARTPELNR